MRRDVFSGGKRAKRTDSSENATTGITVKLKTAIDKMTLYLFLRNYLLLLAT